MWNIWGNVQTKKDTKDHMSLMVQTRLVRRWKTCSSWILSSELVRAGIRALSIELVRSGRLTPGGHQAVSWSNKRFGRWKVRRGCNFYFTTKCRMIWRKLIIEAQMWILEISVFAHSRGCRKGLFTQSEKESHYFMRIFECYGRN